MSRALDGAERKGAEARRAGRPRRANPYPDLRTNKGAITWSRAFRTAWDSGWTKADRTLTALEVAAALTRSEGQP